jgi:hypothetical protein
MELSEQPGNLTGQKYRDNVLAPHVVPHFDNHALADRPMFMDDNARPHRARIVQHFLQQEAVQTIPNDHVTSQIEHGDDVMSTVDVLWVVALSIPDGGGV